MIEEANSQNIDLNLMRPLRMLLEERHVSRAAERCGISQPAMSRILERLRAYLGDELLVRIGRRYERTPRAEILLNDVGDALDRLDATLTGERFEPRTSETRFRLATTDYASVILVPQLLRALGERSPAASLDVAMWTDRTTDDIVAARIDAAIMNAGPLDEAFQRRKLFDERYVCMVGANHSVRGRRMSLATYLAHRHIVIDVVAGAQPSADAPLAGIGVRRRVGLRTPFLGAAVFAAAQTDLILTVPRRLARCYSGTANIRIVAAPPELPGFPYSLIWHKRLDSARAHAWFRDLIYRVAATEIG